MTLKPGDVVQVRFSLWRDWVAYVYAAVPSLLAGREYDYLVRFAHRWTGLKRFIEYDLSEPENDEPWPMPYSQTQGRMTERVTYPPELDPLPVPEPEPAPVPEPPPEPEPTPEPQPEPPPDPPAITMRLETGPGMALLVGDYWPAPGVILTLIGPYGNSYQTRAGSKPEHGPNGFEFIPWPGPGLYTLIAGGIEYTIPIEKFTRLIFETGHPEPLDTLLVSRLLGLSQANLILSKLEKNPKTRERFFIEVQDTSP